MLETFIYNEMFPGSLFQIEAQCGVMWNAVLDTDKLLFINDKMLSTYTGESMEEVVAVCESVLVNHSKRVGDKSRDFYHALIVALTRPSYVLRSQTAAVVKKMINPAQFSERALLLVAELTSFLDSVKITVGSRSLEERESVVNVTDVDIHSLIHALQTICQVGKRDNKNYERLALAAFKAAHYPAILAVQPFCWELMVQRFNQAPKTVVRRCYAQLKEDLIKNHKSGSSWQEASLAGLLKLLPEEAMKDVLDIVYSALGSEDLCRVTRDEYFTFLTPDGELYDRSILENGKDDALRNLKRESQLYSFKEQMEELQLIREMEEKKKREGKIKEPELNPKQKEVLRLQMEKESAIRTKVTVLNASSEQACSLLNTALASIPSILSNHLTRLVPVVMRAMNSPVAAALLYPFWISLRKSVFDANSDLLACGVAYVSQRLMKPQCDLDPAWEKEELEVAARRILCNLHQSPLMPLDASTFTYCFPLIRETLKLLSTQQDPLAVPGIQLLERHAQLRCVEQDGAACPERNPRLLPLKEMMELLIQLIGVWNGREQQVACAALLEVASAASGQAGCAIATDEEVISLLNGLESSVDSIRDACLNGLGNILPVLTKDRNKVSELISFRVSVLLFFLADSLFFVYLNVITLILYLLLVYEIRLYLKLSLMSKLISE